MLLEYFCVGLVVPNITGESDGLLFKSLAVEGLFSDISFEYIDGRIVEEGVSFIAVVGKLVSNINATGDLLKGFEFIGVMVGKVIIGEYVGSIESLPGLLVDEWLSFLAVGKLVGSDIDVGG